MSGLLYAIAVIFGIVALIGLMAHSWLFMLLSAGVSALMGYFGQAIREPPDKPERY